MEHLVFDHESKPITAESVQPTLILARHPQEDAPTRLRAYSQLREFRVL